MPTHYDNFDFRIDGTVLPPPSGYNYNEADLVENSTRNGKGFASWDVVRQNVGNLELSWDNLDGDRLKQVIRAIRGKKSFNVHFFNTLTGDHETRVFYSGDRATQLARYVSAVKYWATLTIPFTEV